MSNGTYLSEDLASQTTPVCFPYQLSRKLEDERQQREEMERVCEELYVAEQEQAQRQREIVSKAASIADPAVQANTAGLELLTVSLE